MNEIFEVRNSVKFGRHLVALKDFKEGELVYVEEPLLVFPDFKNTPNLVEDLVICLGCYMIFPISEVVKCRNCEWNLCSEKCAQEEFHKNYECDYLVGNPLEYTGENAAFIGIIRLIICWKRRTGRFDKWRAFWNLSPNYGDPTGELNDVIQETCDSTYDFVTSKLNLELDKHLISGIVRRILVNSFSTFDRDELGIPYAAEVVFENCSLLAHSCAPNMDWSLAYSHTDRDIRWKMRLFAKLDIKIGDNLTIPYMQNYMERGMMERQSTIFEFFHFLCKCPRCSDPTEMETYFSGILCSKCITGILTPEYPLNWNTDWVCNTCSQRMTVEDVESIEEKFDQNLATFIEMAEKNYKLGARKIDNLIEWATTIHHLHPNHNLVIRAIHHYLNYHDMDILLDEGKDSRKTYETILERANRCINIGKTIGTAENWGVMEGTIAMAMIRHKFKSKDYVTIEKDYKPKKKRSLLQEIVSHIGNALNLMERLPLTKVSWPIRRVLKHRYDIWNNHLDELNKVKVKLTDIEPGIKKPVELPVREKSVELLGRNKSFELRGTDARTLINPELEIESHDLYPWPMKDETILAPLNSKPAKLKGMFRRMEAFLPRMIVNHRDQGSSMAVRTSAKDSPTDFKIEFPDLKTQSIDDYVTAWKRDTLEFQQNHSSFPEHDEPKLHHNIWP